MRIQTETCLNFYLEHAFGSGKMNDKWFDLHCLEHYIDMPVIPGKEHIQSTGMPCVVIKGRTNTRLMLPIIMLRWNYMYYVASTDIVPYY